MMIFYMGVVYTSSSVLLLSSDWTPTDMHPTDFQAVYGRAKGLAFQTLINSASRQWWHAASSLQKSRIARTTGPQFAGLLAALRIVGACMSSAHAIKTTHLKFGID